MTEAKIQEQLSELGINRISIEPLGIDKWSVANDNPFTIFLRSSLGIPDPHEAINVLNALIDAEQQIAIWLQTWEQSQLPGSVGIEDDSG